MTGGRADAASARPADRHASGTGEAISGVQPDGAVDALYRDHAQRLVSILARQTGCREIALDLAHEAFEKLLRIAPAQFLGIRKPDAYLRRVSANIAHDWGRGRAAAERARAELGTVSEDQLDQVAALESRDTLRRLEAVLGKLKPKTRQIFLAHRLHGFSYAEIAKQTGLSIKGVEKQMSKAIANIDRFLDRG